MWCFSLSACWMKTCFLEPDSLWLVPPLVCSVRGRGLSVSSITGSDAADIRTIDRWSITACRPAACAESKQFYYLWVFILCFEWLETQNTTETRQTFNFKLWKSLTFRSIIVSFLEFVVCPTHSNSTEGFHTCPRVRKQSWDTNRKRVDVLHREDEEGRIDDVTSGKQREKKWRRREAIMGRRKGRAAAPRARPSILEDHERRRHSARH